MSLNCLELVCKKFIEFVTQAPPDHFFISVHFLISEVPYIKVVESRMDEKASKSPKLWRNSNLQFGCKQTLQKDFFFNLLVTDELSNIAHFLNFLLMATIFFICLTPSWMWSCSGSVSREMFSVIFFAVICYNSCLVAPKQCTKIEYHFKSSCVAYH